MIVVPIVTPVIVPFSDPIVAAAVLLLVHTPPPTASLSVVVSFAQTPDAPIIAVGDKPTVIVVMAIQPSADV